MLFFFVYYHYTSIVLALSPSLIFPVCSMITLIFVVIIKLSEQTYLSSFLVKKMAALTGSRSERMKSFFLTWIKWTVPLIFMIPGIYPFINGLGCKFTFVHDGKYNFQEGVCKYGILDVYIKSKSDGSITLKKFLWGASSSHIYTYYLSQEKIKKPIAHEVDRINKLYDTSLLISGYRVKMKRPENTYLTYYDKPIEMIYVSKIKGKMGVFYK